MAAYCQYTVLYDILVSWTTKILKYHENTSILTVHDSEYVTVHMNNPIDGNTYSTV